MYLVKGLFLQVAKHCWGIGVLILLLQLTTICIPIGEQRDWAYYLLTGMWAALFITAGVVGRLQPFAFPHILRCCEVAFTFYAIAALSWYFIIPLINWLFLWVWLLSFATSYAWIKPLNIKKISTRFAYGATIIWLLLCAFSLSGSLIYSSGWFGLLLQGDGLKYGVPFIISCGLMYPFIYRILCKPYSDKNWRPFPTPAWYILLHILAIYCFIVPFFRTEALNTWFAIHHWKAFLESGASVRSGGWLLWDVPSQYGFLQTLAIVLFPGATAWQSFYLLNGTLLCLSGYMLFFALFTKFNSISGFIFSLIVALAGAAQLLSSFDPRALPSLGAMSFFWIYPMVGYVYYNCRLFFQTGKMQRFSCLGGHIIWLIGVLWSLESAIFMSFIWLPAFALFSIAEVFYQKTDPSFSDIGKHSAKRFFQWIALIGFAIFSIALFYYTRLGHLPDIYLFAAYSTSYTGGFEALPIFHIGVVACWLFIFAIITMIARFYIANAIFKTQGILNIAVFYTLLSALWAMVSVYIPRSDEGHLVASFPVLIYLSAISILLIPTLKVPVIIKFAYEKCIMCFYCIIILGALNCFKPEWYASERLLSPVSSDITTIFPTPPQWLQDIVAQAGVPLGSNVQILAERLSLDEDAYFHDLQLQPWLLPNTVVGYNKPLSPELYQLLAQRRAERMPDDSYGWIIERKDNPLENYPWIKNAIDYYYKELSRTENSEYRIRKYIKSSR